MHVFLGVVEFVGGQGIVYPSVCLNSRAIIGSVLLWLLWLLLLLIRTLDLYCYCLESFWTKGIIISGARAQRSTMGKKIW